LEINKKSTHILSIRAAERREREVVGRVAGSDWSAGFLFYQYFKLNYFIAN
jgi:hypothetical protein